MIYDLGASTRSPRQRAKEFHALGSFQRLGAFTRRALHKALPLRSQYDAALITWGRGFMENKAADLNPKPLNPKPLEQCL